MDTIKINSETHLSVPCVATIGFFDGVHRGHQYLISHVVAEAEASGMRSVVITFDRHPRQVLHSDYVPKLLSTLDAKLLQLSKTRIDVCALLHFDLETASLSAYDFMRTVLRDRLNVRKLVIGYDNRFGHNRTEGFDDYVRYGRELGIEVVQHQAFVLNGVKVSSSVIRSFIKEGEIELANQCLGYPYTIIGQVVDGYKEGRKLGFPTANLDTSAYGQLLPAAGVYGVKVRLQQQVAEHRGMTNIGTRPTFGGDSVSVETHIFNFTGNLYGQQLLVSFVHHVRQECKFADTGALIAQLKEDKKQVEQQFENDLGE
ncbi:riboflavin kinase / FMN adenylyltransferase [Prevotellaceae bacterium KH2P17]|nr:riboflavin kinase / FMN adenylyltransferase [Prevotellaceae bacterium KH2P17]